MGVTREGAIRDEASEETSEGDASDGRVFGLVSLCQPPEL